MRFPVAFGGDAVDAGMPVPVWTYFFLYKMILILSILLFFASEVCAQDPSEPSPVVGKVIIRNLDVFDSRVPKYTHFPYPFLNQLHIPTRIGVIRSELLFKTGDPFNPALLEESARNLRKFPFLGRVSIRSITLEDSTFQTRRVLSKNFPSAFMPSRTVGSPPNPLPDTVNVVVETEDQWTTVPDLVFDRRGSLTRMGIGVEESNFLGFGKYFNLRFLTSTDRNLVRVIYQDPRFLGTRWTLQTTGIKTSEGKLGEVNFARPQYAVSNRWAFDSNYHYEQGVFRLYESGRESAFVGNGLQEGDGSITRIWGERGLQQKVSLTLAGMNRSFSDSIHVVQPTSPSAQDLLASGTVARRNLRLETSWTVDHFRFVKKRGIDHAGLVEDIKLGQTLSLTLGEAYGIGREQDYTLFGGSFVTSAGLGASHLAIFSIEGQTHLERGHLNNSTLEAFYHHYYQGLPWQTFALGMAYRSAWHMDQPFQFVLGEYAGLRGYPAREFAGDHLFLLNFEDRIFTPIEFATLRLGFAPFFDAGMAWPHGQTARWDDLRTSVGIGLRLGVVKFAGDPVFRIDVAFPLHHASGIGNFSIGISFSPIFWSFQGPETIVKRFI